jgi:hypothetical protein
VLVLLHKGVYGLLWGLRVERVEETRPVWSVVDFLVGSRGSFWRTRGRVRASLRWHRILRVVDDWGLAGVSEL